MISIIIPTRDRDKELVRAIRSATSQIGVFVEVIVVDDSSSFDVKTYLDNNLNFECLSCVKVLRNEKCVGAAAARNIGAHEAQGFYLSFLDSDDYWDPKKLQKQLVKFIANPQLDVVYCDQLIVSSGIVHESKKAMIHDNIMENLLAGWTAPNPSTLVIRKESFMSIGGFDETLQASEDHELWFRIAHNRLTVGFVDEPLSYFSQDSGGRLSFDLRKRVSGVLCFTDKCAKYVNKRNFKRFRRANIFKVVYPIFFYQLKRWKFGSAIYIFARYLLCNKTFYYKVCGAVFVRLSNFWRVCT